MKSIMELIKKKKRKERVSLKCDIATVILDYTLENLFDSSDANRFFGKDSRIR